MFSISCVPAACYIILFLGRPASAGLLVLNINKHQSTQVLDIRTLNNRRLVINVNPMKDLKKRILARKFGSWSLTLRQSAHTTVSTQHDYCLFKLEVRCVLIVQV